MKLKVQLVICADDGREEQVQEVATLDKDCQRIEHLGFKGSGHFRAILYAKA